MIKRKFYKRIITLLFMIASVASSFSPVLVYATPSYSDDYQSINSIETGASGYYSVNCNNVNISTTWRKYITDPSTWSNPGDASNPNSWNYQAKSSFETALVSGRYGASQYIDYAGGGYAKYVVIFWTEDNSMSLSWNSNGIDASGAGVHSVNIGCRNVYLGNGGSEPIALNPFTGGVRISNDTTYNPNPTTRSEAYGIANYFVRTDHPNCPSGYAQCIPDVSPVTGNVQCANTTNTISAVQVNVASGLDGNATISDDGVGGKNYSYYLTGKDTPYSLVVICDGDTFYGPTVNANFYDHYNWACSTVGERINVCAAA